MDAFNQDEDFIPVYLSRLEETVLEELSLREKNYSIRFNGLRRVLKDVHQQKLSRALERLQEDHLIVQYPDGGYGLGGNSYEMIREYFRGDTKDYFKLDSSPKQIFSAISSDNNFPVQKIVSKLAGKYFGAFRFIGHYYSNGEGRLEWIHGEDHSRILISSVTSSNIEIVAYNVSKVAINKFLNILRHVLIDYQILVEFSNTTSSQVN
jgi:hypothetical protein